MTGWALRVPVTVLVGAFLLAGCGYFKAGAWEDDAGNWTRAFASKRPEDVNVVHSRYWRAAHWTAEFGYFFEIAPNATLREQLFSKNKLRQVRGDEAATVKDGVFGDAPSWFAPKGVSEYDVWVYADEPRGNFRILIDKGSGHMYLADHQV
jgi:hypothetical protein